MTGISMRTRPSCATCRRDLINAQATVTLEERLVTDCYRDVVRGRLRNTPGALTAYAGLTLPEGLLVLAIHPDGHTTPAVRTEIARSQESSGVLASRYGVSTETIRTWRRRGPADCQDRSARPHKPPWKAREEEHAIVCALHRATGFPLDDLSFILTHPHALPATPKPGCCLPHPQGRRARPAAAGPAHA